MKNILKRLAASALLFSVFTMPILVPASVSAATNPYAGVCTGGGGGSSPVCSSTTTDPIAGPNGAIMRVTTILATVAGMVSVIFVVWGGFKYITSGGDSNGTATAKNMIIAALVGLVIALLARPIINFVIGRV